MQNSECEDLFSFYTEVGGHSDITFLGGKSDITRKVISQGFRLLVISRRFGHFRVLRSDIDDRSEVISLTKNYEVTCDITSDRSQQPIQKELSKELSDFDKIL